MIMMLWRSTHVSLCWPHRSLEYTFILFLIKLARTQNMCTNFPVHLDNCEHRRISSRDCNCHPPCSHCCPRRGSWLNSNALRAEKQCFRAKPMSEWRQRARVGEWQRKKHYFRFIIWDLCCRFRHKSESHHKNITPIISLMIASSLRVRVCVSGCVVVVLWLLLACVCINIHHSHWLCIHILWYNTWAHQKQKQRIYYNNNNNQNLQSENKELGAKPNLWMQM